MKHKTIKEQDDFDLGFLNNFTELPLQEAERDAYLLDFDGRSLFVTKRGFLSQARKTRVLSFLSPTVEAAYD